MEKTNLDYMTQYSYMNDEGYYQAMADQVKLLDSEILNQLMDLVPYVDDKYNKILFDLLFIVNDDQLTILVDMWEALKDKNIGDFLDIMNTDTYELMGDNAIYTFYELEEIADEDLKINGVNANALYWYNDLIKNTFYNYFVFNGYMNGFYYYSDMYEAFNDFVDDNTLRDLIVDFL